MWRAEVRLLTNWSSQVDELRTACVGVGVALDVSIQTPVVGARYSINLSYRGEF